MFAIFLVAKGFPELEINIITIMRAATYNTIKCTLSKFIFLCLPACNKIGKDNRRRAKLSCILAEVLSFAKSLVSSVLCAC